MKKNSTYLALVIICFIVSFITRYEAYSQEIYNNNSNNDFLENICINSEFCATKNYKLSDNKYLSIYGNFVQSGMVIAEANTSFTLILDDRAMLSYPHNGKYIAVFGFGRDAKQMWDFSIITEDSKKLATKIEIAKRKYNVQRIDGLPKKMVSPPESVWQRIKQENNQVKIAREVFSPKFAFLEGFIAPTYGRVSGIYGSQRILNGKPKRPHFGIDIAIPTGTPVIAPADGVVTMVHDDMYYTGGTMIIDHGMGISSTFIHLSKSLVTEGDDVKKGQKIGLVGATGRATGPHLDWRVNWFEQRLDPGFLVDTIAKDKNSFKKELEKQL